MSSQKRIRGLRHVSLLLASLAFVLLMLLTRGDAEAVADTVEGIDFHPFTMDAGNNTCVPWDEPTSTTRNCDPVNLLFPDHSIADLNTLLQQHGWGTSGFGSSQQLHFTDDTLHSQDLQLYLSESSTLRYHIRLWQVPGNPQAAVGAVHHESGFLIHTIDMSWEDAEAFVAGQLCGAELACQSSQSLGWQETIQAQDPDGNPAKWRDWDNNGQVTIISLSQFDTPPAVAIDRQAADVVLSWPPVEDAVTYQVYRSATPYFTPGTPLETVATTVYTDTAIVDSGINHYYKVLAVDALARESPESNQVGLNFLPVSPGWNLLSWPILPADTALEAVLGDQLYGTADPLTADQVIVWSPGDQSYDSAWYCGGPDCDALGEPYADHWLATDYTTSTLTLEPDTGFWIQNRSGFTETLVLTGAVADADRSVPVGQNWSLLGSAFPVAKPLDSANLPAAGTDSPITADRVLYWDAAAQAYRSAWYCGGPICAGWGEPWANHWLAGDYAPTDIVLEPGKGFWVQNRYAAFVWLNLLGEP